MTIDEANQEVTTAIFEADAAIEVAYRAYRRLESAEIAIANFPGVSSLEKSIADRGVGFARQALHVLQALRRYKENHIR